MKILLYIWQLPQNIIGLIMSIGCECTYVVMKDKTIKKVYFHKLNPKTAGEAVTLGEYIFLDVAYKNKYSKSLYDTAYHEYGHVKQSRMLGWFYLLVIGVPSFVHAIFHKKGDYSHFYTEKWADKLGKQNIK